MAADPLVASTGGDTIRPSLVTGAALAVVVGAMAAVMFASHRAGHWWGDDWALYIRQAQSLVDGNPGQVIDENRFTVETSRGPAFSPPLYPWGFPIVLAPFVAVVGADVDQLAVVPVLCAVVFACSWFALARRRVGAVAALLGTVAVTLTPLLLGWTELIQSEWPFLAVVFAVLVLADRLSVEGTFVDLSARLWPLALAGFGAAAAFTVRREGLGMVAGIALAQAAALPAVLSKDLLRDADRRVRLLLRLLVPHMTALATVVVLQVTLPSTLVPQYSGTGVGNVWKFRRRHIEHLLEVAGIMRPWQDEPIVLGSSGLGWTAAVTYLTLAATGVVLAVAVHRRRDLHLVGYAVAAFLIGGSFRSAINRYVVTIAPILLLFALAAVAAAAGATRWPQARAVLASVALLPLVVGNVWQAVDRVDSARTFADAGAVEWGPNHPAAIEMFEQVRRLTAEGDVVAAPKARAMTLATDLLAVQVDDVRPIPPGVDLALVVVEADTRLEAELASSDDLYVEVWRNSRFAIFQPASRAAASAATNGAGSSSTASP